VSGCGRDVFPKDSVFSLEGDFAEAIPLDSNRTVTPVHSTPLHSTPIHSPLQTPLPQCVIYITQVNALVDLEEGFIIWSQWVKPRVRTMKKAKKRAKKDKNSKVCL